jgi:hypothetical protein
MSAAAGGFGVLPLISKTSDSIAVSLSSAVEGPPLPIAQATKLDFWDVALGPSEDLLANDSGKYLEFGQHDPVHGVLERAVDHHVLFRDRSGNRCGASDASGASGTLGVSGVKGPPERRGWPPRW